MENKKKPEADREIVKLRNVSWAWGWDFTAGEWPESEYVWAIINWDDSSEREPSDYNDYEACDAYHHSHYHFSGKLLRNDNTENPEEIWICGECIEEKKFLEPLQTPQNKGE